jgi:hypothetical protein
MLLISFSFNHTTIFCTNICVAVLINQYSTGLFVSYSVKETIDIRQKQRKTSIRRNVIGMKVREPFQRLRLFDPLAATRQMPEKLSRK